MGEELIPRSCNRAGTVTGVCQECASVPNELGLLSNCAAGRAQELKSNCWFLVSLHSRTIRGTPRPGGSVGLGERDSTAAVGKRGTKKMSREDKIRVLCVDDHPLMRVGIVTVVRHESDMDVVGEASTGREAIDLFQELRPDITL